MPKLLNKVNLPRYSSAPSTPSEADLYYNTSDDKIYVYNGAAWVEVGSGAGSEIYYQSGAPSSPADGDIWIDSDDEVASVTSVTDSTSTTSSTVAASATAVKSAYDLANGAIPKTLTTTTGDVIYASAANTPARLGIGTTNQVLSVVGGIPSWATLAAAGADVQEFTSSGTWTKPAGKTAVFVFAIGGGGGGAAGARSSVGVAARGGNSGAGAAHAQRWMAASELAGTVTVTIGAGGAGGTAVAANTTTINGSSGVKGGDTSFGTHLAATGGGFGVDSNGTNVGLPFTGTWEWGYNLTVSGTAGGTSDAGDAVGDLDPSTLATRYIGPTLNYALSSTTAVLNAVRAMTRSGHGAKGGLAAATAASSRGGGAGARGFGSNGSVPNGGGYAGDAVNATAAQAGSVCTVGVGHGGGGGGPAINATPSAGGAGYLGGGGGGGGGLQTSTSRANAAGGAGGDGYIIVVSV